MSESRVPPAAPAAVFEAVQPELATDSNGVAVYKGSPLATSAGPCKAQTIKGGTVR